MNVSGDSVLWVIGAGATIAGLVFQFSFYLGRLTQEVKTLRDTSDRHGEAIDSLQLQNRMRP